MRAERRAVQRAHPSASRPVIPTTRPGWERMYAASLPLLDVLALVVSAGLAVLLHPDGRRVLTLTELGQLALVLVTWPLALAVGGAYESRTLGFGSEEFKTVLTTSVQYALVVMAGCFVLGVDVVAYVPVLLLATGTLLLLVARRVARQRLWAQRARGLVLHKMLVVGPPEHAAQIVREISGHPETGFEVVAVCTPQGRGTYGPITPGREHEVFDAIARYGVDTVAVVGGVDMPTDFIRRLAWRLEETGIDLMVAPAITDVAGPRVHVRPVATLAMLYVEKPRFSGPTRVAKGIADRVGALVLLLAVSPLLLLSALLVVTTSRGPALFRQARLGIDGQPFRIYKLRTMVDGADRQRADLLEHDGDGLLFKLKADPRVTPVGRWLRRFSVDELPQLLNVLRGQMSLIGPRPLPEQLEDHVGDAQRRLLVKPGMTGLWQVSGRSDLDWEESVRLDLYYVENWSLALDLVILARTLAVVVRGAGAY